MNRLQSLTTQRFPHLAVLALGVAALFSIGFFQSDEHFQILEFAALKLGLISAEMMPWEYAHQMRSSLLPTIALLLHRTLGFAGMDDPFVVTTILRLLSASISFAGMYLIYLAYRDKFENQPHRKVFSYLSFLLWCNIFVGVRFSSEGWSASLIVIAIAYFLLKKESTNYFVTGLLLGMAFLCRYQVGAMVLGFGLWLLIIRKENILKLASMAGGFLLVFALGVLLDRWFYGEWTLSIWHYLDQNILQDKISDFGVDPWFAYLPMTLLALIPPYSLIVVFALLALVIKKPKSMLVWIFIPFLLVHSMIGHKELRFLFPLLGFVPVVVLQGYRLWSVSRFKGLISRLPKAFVVKSFHWINSALLLFICFCPLDRTTPLYREIYYDVRGPAKIYYRGADPYKEGHLSYYKRPNLTVEEYIGQQLSFSHDTTYLFVGDRPQVQAPPPFTSKPHYSTIPRWAYYFNFNGWIERTRAWYLYKVE